MIDYACGGFEPLIPASKAINSSVSSAWASYQIRKIVCCECAGNAGNVFSRHRVCYTRAVIHAGIVNWWFPLKSVEGKTFPAFPVHACYVSGKKPIATYPCKHAVMCQNRTEVNTGHWSFTIIFQIWFHGNSAHGNDIITNVIAKWQRYHNKHLQRSVH